MVEPVHRFWAGPVAVPLMPRHLVKLLLLPLLHPDSIKCAADA